MMHLPWLALMLAAPFWEAKPPAEWTPGELWRIFSDSPWAQTASYDSRIGGATTVRVYLATAQPMREAEQQARLRGAQRKAAPGVFEQEYQEFLGAQAARHIVLAVSGWTAEGMSNGEETRQMEKHCLMKAGRNKYRMTGYFPPSPADPYLRLIFPRVVKDSDKRIVFEIYVPGATPPYREVFFKVRELSYKGRLEM